jgi:alpha-2-macroglobulin-like protein
MKFHQNTIGLLVICTLLVAFNSAEEIPFLQTLKKKLSEYNRSFPEEKIYIQLDKPFYKPGEDIWFNVFLVNSNSNKPSTISDVVYVELINPKGNVAAKAELVVREGSANGDFAIDENMPGGMYQVRAFTQWMKNFGEHTFFKKNIQVQKIITPRLLLKLDYGKESYGPSDQVVATVKVSNLKNEKVVDASLHYQVSVNGKRITNSNVVTNSQGEGSIRFELPAQLTSADGLLQVVVQSKGVEESISRSIPIVLNKITVQFFPEGGQCVSGTEGRVALKALNEFGKGADVSGSILDEENNIVTSFETYHMGMGAFTIKPESGKKYYAKIERPLGNESLVPLPEPQQKGFALGLLTVSKERAQWRVHSPYATTAHFVGTAHGEIYYAEKINLKSGTNDVEVPIENFPAGVAVFTLFDGAGTEQCERLGFLHADKGLNIRLKQDKEKYSPGEKVEVKIETTDSNGKPISSKLALAVIDDQVISFADDKQDNILSSFLLSSEVRGDIQEPSFYFDRSEPKAPQALDYLLMTQGWRRFSWKEVMTPQKNIVYVSEKIKNISGRVVIKGSGALAEITLVELGNKRRIDKIKTAATGHFIFKNIDPTVPVLLLTKKPAEIVIEKEENLSIHLNDKDGNVLVQDTIGQSPMMAQVVKSKEMRDEETIATENDGLNLRLTEDVTSLQEVIVTSLGYSTKNSLSSSITVIEDKDISMPTQPFENALQGRVAGVMLYNQSGIAGASPLVKIRGVSSFAAGRGEPLYVVDGFPISSSLNQNFSNGGIVGHEDILSVEIISSPEASALFGSAASNGVIMITTRTNLARSNFKTRSKPGNYIGKTIQPRKFSATREFYVGPPAKRIEKREDFRTTVYWNHNIVTDEQGKATLSFYNGDAISAYRMTAEGLTATGLIGRAEAVYSTELPFSLDAKLPEFLGFEDTLRLPIRVKNETASHLSGKIKIQFPEQLAVVESTIQDIDVNSNTTKTFWFTITSRSVAGEYPLAITLETPQYNDKIERTIRVRPVGIPVQRSFSGQAKDKTFTVNINEAEKGSLTTTFTAFPDVLNDLFTGVESILREPHGCFEQVSSSTFPNIFVLQLLRQSGATNPDIERRALTYIQNGYKQLTAYEIKGGGFEWFGHPPAHAGLTAYGLLEFHEMKKVFPGVDEKMIDRTRQWLMDLKDGKGGFQAGNGKYGFSGASHEVTNAYIVYALSETGTKDIELEYNYALQEALRSQDMYRMALLAIASYNLGEMVNYNKLVDIFKSNIKSNGFLQLKADHSMVRGYGNSLRVETISLWATALMKSTPTDLFLVSECVKEIVSCRSYGQFGSTQGTTLALKVLTEYSKFIRSQRSDGTIKIFVNDAQADQFSYKKDDQEKITMNAFGKVLNDGEQKLRIAFSAGAEPLPYSLDLLWYTKHPQGNEKCKVRLSTKLASPVVKVNETIRLNIHVQNITTQGLPMATAVIGIPSGLSVQPWQIKDLQEKNAFDFYEIADGNLILYYRELEPAAIRAIALDLKAEIPGSFTSAASSVYLYYTNEFKHWEPGTSISVREK